MKSEGSSHSQMNPIHNIPLNFFKIHFNIIFSATPRSSNWSSALLTHTHTHTHTHMPSSHVIFANSTHRWQQHKFKYGEVNTKIVSVHSKLSQLTNVCYMRPRSGLEKCSHVQTVSSLSLNWWEMRELDYWLRFCSIITKSLIKVPELNHFMQWQTKSCHSTSEDMHNTCS
jgi:hypothetical protein